jgi:hypothetical protein
VRDQLSHPYKTMETFSALSNKIYKTLQNKVNSVQNHIDERLTIMTQMFFSPCAWVSCYDDIWGSGSKVSRIFKLALDRGEWSALHPDCFTTDESILGAYWIGGLVGHRTDFIVTAKRKIPRLFGNRTLFWK